MRRISIIGSYFFHPIWTPTFFIGILFFGLSNSVYAVLLSPLQKGIICLSVFFYSALIPALGIIFAQKFQLIDSIQLTHTTSRKTAFAILICYYIVTAQFWNSWNYLHIIKSFFYAISLILLIIILFLPKQSVSAHMAGMGLLGTALLLNLNSSAFSNVIWILVCIALSGPVGFFRLFLNAHTENELLSGYLTGILSGWISFMFL